MLGRTPKKPNIAESKEENGVCIIGADWDGTFDILFKELFESEYYKKKLGFSRSDLEAQQTLLNNVLDEVTKGRTTELYVLSFRQHETTDHRGHFGGDDFPALGTGLCLENLPKLCKERGWTYRNKLLGHADAGDDKIFIVRNHLEDIQKNHPHKKVDYIVIDDDKRILSSLKQQLTKEANAYPPNIHIHLVYFSWYFAILNKRIDLEAIASICHGKEINQVAQSMPTSVPSSVPKLEVLKTIPEEPELESQATPAPDSLNTRLLGSSRSHSTSRFNLFTCCFSAGSEEEVRPKATAEKSTLSHVEVKRTFG